MLVTYHQGVRLPRMRPWLDSTLPECLSAAWASACLQYHHARFLGCGCIISLCDACSLLSCWEYFAGKHDCISTTSTTAAFNRTPTKTFSTKTSSSPECRTCPVRASAQLHS